MNELLIRLQHWLARHRAWVLAVVALAAVAAALFGRRLVLNEDFTQMLPMSDPAIAGHVQALQYIRQTDRLFVDVHTPEQNPERLAEAADAMAAALRDIPELQDLRDRFDESELLEVYAELRERLPLLLSAEDLQALSTRLEPGALEKRLTWFKQALAQPQGFALKEVAQHDPVGLADIAATRLRALQAGVGEASLVGGRITSADGRHVLLSATPAFRPADLPKSEALLARVLQSAREVEKRFPQDAVKIAVTGAHRMALDNARMIQCDTTRTMLFAMVAVVGLILAAYPRRMLALLGVAPTLFGCLASMAAFVLTGEAMSAVALGCGSILVGVTVDYGIYVLYHLESNPPPDRQAMGSQVARLMPTLSFGALTAMSAFLVMLVSPISGHRQLGVFGLIGIGLAAVFAMLILPLLIPLRKNAATRVLPLTARIDDLFRWRDRHSRIVLPILIVFTIVCGAGLLRLRFEGEMSRLNGVQPATQADDDTIRTVWGKALSLTTVVARGHTREEALKRNEAVYHALRPLQAAGQIETLSSVAPLQPSAETQRRQLDQWRAFWSTSRLHSLSNDLAAVTDKLGFRAEAFAPFLEQLCLRPPETADTLDRSALDQLLQDYWNERDGNFSILTLVKAPDRASFQKVREAVGQAAPEALLLNKAVLTDEIAQIARRGLPVFAVLVGVSIGLLLFFMFGRIELAALALLPMAVGVWWTLGTLGLLGWPVDMANFIFVIFVIGVGGDYSIFLLSAELERLRGSATQTSVTGAAVTLCALTTLFGVGVLVLAEHPALFSVGLAALLGISFSLMATLFLVPLGMNRLRRAMSAPVTGTVEPDPARLRPLIHRLYRYYGPYVSQFAYWKLRTDPLFSAVEQASIREGQILDLGCGYGLVAHWLTLAAPGRHVMGVDYDLAKIRVATATARQNASVTFEHRNLLIWQEYPACDQALLCDVLHYFPRKVKSAILCQAYAALRSGGRLLLRDACRQTGWRHTLVDWAERCALRTGQNKSIHGLHFESAEDHEALLREAGFDRIEIISNAGLGSNCLLVAYKVSA